MGPQLQVRPSLPSGSPGPTLPPRFVGSTTMNPLLFRVSMDSMSGKYCTTLLKLQVLQRCQKRLPANNGGATAMRLVIGSGTRSNLKNYSGRDSA
jgi:hypothetical protein